ncbi:Cyt-b5 [Symbiodinium natans]|uniref:Cyt-b5 protein n=1 Tax=Symbiodinium natans TaxID=878477 RepID=A0A812HDL3_9DINO|nr:Cyt-b5 [Symbiodinium natans]
MLAEVKVVADVRITSTDSAVNNNSDRDIVNVRAHVKNGRDATTMINKIPGWIPSKQWMEPYMSLELKMGKVGPGGRHHPWAQELLGKLQRLEGPSQEDIEAAKTVVKVPGRWAHAVGEEPLPEAGGDFRGQGPFFSYATARRPMADDQRCREASGALRPAVQH